MTRAERLNDPGRNAAGAGIWLRAPLICAWLLILISYSFTDRDTPRTIGALDLLALAKISTRIIAFGVLGYVISRTRDRRRFRDAMRCLWPFGLFVAWALASTLWSPLRAVSLGQAVSLMVLWMLALCIAMLWRSPRDTSRILSSLSVAMLLYSAVMLASYIVFPGDPTRGRFASSLAHPATAGATASLGIVVLVAARLLWGWRWSTVLLLPGILIHGGVILMALDRTSMALAVGMVIVMLCVFANRAWLAAACLGLSVAGMLYLTVDPGLEIAGDGAEAVVALVTRGQTIEQLRSFSGRDEIWELMWESVTQSPWIGHGFFVSSETGSMDVWGRTANFTAHNAFFQALVSTGLIGVILFAWGLWQPCWTSLRCLGAEGGARTTAVFAMLIGAWLMGWGMLATGIMSQLLPPSVVCFAVLGIVAGQLSPAQLNHPLRLGRVGRLSMGARA